VLREGEEEEWEDARVCGPEEMVEGPWFPGRLVADMPPDEDPTAEDGMVGVLAGVVRVVSRVDIPGEFTMVLVPGRLGGAMRPVVVPGRVGEAVMVMPSAVFEMPMTRPFPAPSGGSPVVVAPLDTICAGAVTGAPATKEPD